jgi:hypothetical protein
MKKKWDMLYTENVSIVAVFNNDLLSCTYGRENICEDYLVTRGWMKINLCIKNLYFMCINTFLLKRNMQFIPALVFYKDGAFS